MADPTANGGVVVSGAALAAALEKPELTCISEEGIADMDLPDNIFDDFDIIGDCITSCNKVENYLMLSEFENNLNVKIPNPNDRAKQQHNNSLFVKNNSCNNTDTVRNTANNCYKN